MFLEGIPLPPLGSVQDGVLRSVFVKRKVRKLRETTLLILSQGSTKEAQERVSSLFKEYFTEMLDREGIEQRDEAYWRAEYEHMKNELVNLQRKEDGGLKVTGLNENGDIQR